MKSLNQYITEKLKVSKKQYNYCPQTREELDNLLDKLLKERGWEADLNDIDTSNITDMSNLFTKRFEYNFTDFNGDISGWDVSNVTNMEGMFSGCESFNRSLNDWDVSNVTDMYDMFGGCKEFEGKGLENWDVSNVIYMSLMFYNCKKFNTDISGWNVSNLKYYTNIFNSCPIKDEYKPKL